MAKGDPQMLSDSLTTVPDAAGRPIEPIIVRFKNSRASANVPQCAAVATVCRCSNSNQTERQSHMHIDQMFPSKFMRYADLNGRPMRVTIQSLKREDVGGEQKIIMTFANGDAKQLILNKTNARAIAKALGDETKAWLGKDIVLVPAQVDFRGDIVDAIRVKAASVQSTAAGPNEPPPFDDDVEF
jgi:hypothetical protein